MEEKPVSLWKSSLTYGLYLGIALILVSVIYYATGNTFAKSAQWVNFAIMIAGVIVAQLNYRILLGKEITYGQVFGIGLLTMVFASVLSGFYTYLLYGIIDPSLQEQLHLSIEEQIVRQGNVPEEQIDMAVEMATKFQKPAIMFVMSILGSSFIGILISLYASIFVGAWLLFEKAEQSGWKSLVPIVNIIVLLKIVEKPVWWIFIILLVPLVNIVFIVWLFNLLSKRFGKDEWFTVGLILLGFIFIPILGFDNSEYQKLDNTSL